MSAARARFVEGMSSAASTLNVAADGPARLAAV